MDCSLPGSSIHGIFQARVLEWGTIFFSNDAVYIMLNAILDESQAGIKIAGAISATSDMHKDTSLRAESKDELKSLLMRVKEESEKASLKLNIQKTKIMVSGLITSWQTDGGKGETVVDFIFFSSKITVDSDCSHKIKNACSLEGSYEKATQCITKQRQHFPNKGPFS